MKKKEINRSEEFAQQLHICMKDGTCAIIDRGLAVCHRSDDQFCNPRICLKIKGEEK